MLAQKPVLRNLKAALFGALIVAMILPFSMTSEHAAAALPSLKEQLNSGVAISDLKCKADRILVIRDNGNPACVTIKTAEKMNWQPFGHVDNTDPKQVFHETESDKIKRLTEKYPPGNYSPRMDFLTLAMTDLPTVGEERVFRMHLDSAKAPEYTVWDFEFGIGIVGGFEVLDKEPTRIDTTADGQEIKVYSIPKMIIDPENDNSELVLTMTATEEGVFEVYRYGVKYNLECNANPLICEEKGIQRSYPGSVPVPFEIKAGEKTRIWVPPFSEEQKLAWKQKIEDLKNNPRVELSKEEKLQQLSESSVWRLCSGQDTMLNGTVITTSTPCAGLADHQPELLPEGKLYRIGELTFDNYPEFLEAWYQLFVKPEHQEAWKKTFAEYLNLENELDDKISTQNFFLPKAYADDSINLIGYVDYTKGVGDVSDNDDVFGIRVCAYDDGDDGIFRQLFTTSNQKACDFTDASGKFIIRNVDTADPNGSGYIDLSYFIESFGDNTQVLNSNSETHRWFSPVTNDISTDQNSVTLDIPTNTNLHSAASVIDAIEEGIEFFDDGRSGEQPDFRVGDVTVFWDPLVLVSDYNPDCATTCYDPIGEDIYLDPVTADFRVLVLHEFGEHVLNMIDVGDDNERREGCIFVEYYTFPLSEICAFQEGFATFVPHYIYGQQDMNYDGASRLDLETETIYLNPSGLGWASVDMHRISPDGKRIGQIHADQVAATFWDIMDTEQHNDRDRLNGVNADALDISEDEIIEIVDAYPIDFEDFYDEWRDEFSNDDDISLLMSLHGMDFANLLPTAVDRTYYVGSGQTKEITLRGNDPEGTPLTFSIFDFPDKGTLNPNTVNPPTKPDGRSSDLDYTAFEDSVGTDTITYKSNDGSDFSPLATITVNIIQTPQKPESVTPTPNPDFIFISWLAPPSDFQILHYEVFRNVISEQRTLGDGFVSVANVTATEYSDYDVTESAGYQYAVRAILEHGISGETSEPTETITIQTEDTVPPTITVPDDITIITNSTLTALDESDYGMAAATDDTDEPHDIAISHNATGYLFPVGSTAIQWVATDTSGNNSTGIQDVTLVQDQIPVIYLNGNGTLNIPMNVQWSDPVSATDDIDGNLTSSIITTGTVDTATQGTYRLTYNVQDSAGNSAEEKSRTVHVVDTSIKYCYKDNKAGNGYDLITLVESGSYNVIDNRGNPYTHINGTDGNDLIIAGGSGDKISAKKGADCIIGDDNRNEIYGDEGADIIHGLGGDDLIKGGSENDHLYGNDGRDHIEGNVHADYIRGGPGNDKLEGNDGNDDVYGDAGNDRLWGQNGHDKLYGGDGKDQLRGGDSVDVLRGNAGHDNLYCGDGSNDTGKGGNGVDYAKDCESRTSIERENPVDINFGW